MDWYTKNEGEGKGRKVSSNERKLEGLKKEGNVRDER